MVVAKHNPIIGVPTERQLKNFFAKVGFDSESGCHPWLGAKGFHESYPGDLTQAQGRFNFNGRTVTAYRFAMFVELGFTDPGPTVDHLCHNRICVNPLHLRCVAQIENNRNRRPILSDYCKNGHIRTDANTYIDTNGNRSCRECSRIRDRQRYEKKYAAEKKTFTNDSTALDYNSNPKLNEKLVLDILHEYHHNQVGSRILARKYKVSSRMILNVINGTSWKHVYAKFMSGEKG